MTKKYMLPIYYQRYDYEYIASLAERLQEKYVYNGIYPLKELSFKADTIDINIYSTQEEGYALSYQFDAGMATWKLASQRKWVSDFYGNIVWENLPENGFSLAEFSYFEYM